MNYPLLYRKILWYLVGHFKWRDLVEYSCTTHPLRYQFETWYIHSVGGTTCRVWVSVQLGQFILFAAKSRSNSFFAIMASQTRQILHIWYIGCPGYTSWYKFRFLTKNLIFGTLAIICVRFGFPKFSWLFGFPKFSGLFLHVLRNRFET